MALPHHQNFLEFVIDELKGTLITVGENEALLVQG